MKRLLVILMTIFTVSMGTVIFAQPASATCFSHCKHWWDYGFTVPGLGDCKSAPTPQMPGRGFSGWIDSGPPNPNPDATTVYDSIQYPPQWHTYDLGCAGAVGNTGAVLDTTVGNWLKGVGTSIVAMCTSLHRFVSPPTFLNKLDPLVLKGSTSIRDSLFTPWIGISILVLGVIIMWSAHRRHLPTAITNIVWAIFILGAATALFTYPVKAGHFADDITTSTVGTINQNMLGEKQTVSDPSSARASLLTDNVLYRQWLIGELGSADSRVAVKYGRLLLITQSYTYAEAKAINSNPDASGIITKIKQQNFQKLASAIKDEDPAAYDCLKTGCGSRIGMGFVTLIAALLTAPFMIMADLLIIIALIIERLLVIFGPGVAPLALHNKSIGRILLSVSALVLLNSIAFAAGAALNALSVGVLLGSTTGLPEWMNILICGVIMAILWGAMRPFRKLTSMASFAQVKSSAAGAATASGTRRKLKHIAGIGAGVFIANKLSHRTQTDEEEEQPQVQQPVVEEYSRPSPPVHQPLALGAAPAFMRPPTSAGMGDITGEHIPTAPQPPGPTPEHMPATPYIHHEALGGADLPALPGSSSNDIALPIRNQQLPGPYTPPPEPHGDVYAANEDLPRPVFRADPVVQDGNTVYRIWDSSTKTYHVVKPEGSTGEGTTV